MYQQGLLVSWSGSNRSGGNRVSKHKVNEQKKKKKNIPWAHMTHQRVVWAPDNLPKAGDIARCDDVVWAS